MIDFRAKVTQAARDLEHPYKSYLANDQVNQRLVGVPHKFGRLVYSDGAVGGNFGTKKAARYLIARGASSDESIWALAWELGFIDWGPPVEVEEVDAGWFWLFANPGGRLPEGQ